MPEFLRNTLFSESFIPQGFCLHWDPTLMYVLIAANVGIALAYFSIPAALWHFIKKRKDLAYSWMFRLFAVFITASGFSHVIKVVTLYKPYYWLEALIDFSAAAVSLLAALLLWPLIPSALQLRSPAELAEANTKLKAMNEKMQEVNTELAKLNEELLAARDQALEATNLKSAFVANISHELRTPLSGIIGMNELLKQTELNEEQQSLNSAVEECAQSLLVIVNDILDLSKIEAGKMALESSQCNPVAIVHDCLQVVLVSAHKKRLKLQTDIDAEVPSCLIGDPVRVHQILLNFVGNAIKFTREGTITVKVSVESETDSEMTLRFAVKDTGIGLSSEEQRYLFLPFSQVDASTTRKYGGTGLGLAINKRLVELLGGEIGVTSAKGEGAAFWFSVPFGKVRTQEPDSISGATETTSMAAKANILVVEDNPILQQLVLKQLEHIGLQASGVANGKAALEELNRHSYTLILMDCHLPELDGFESTRLIRQKELGGDRHIPIVAMTAGAMRSDTERCLAAGMDDYLSKPYTLKQLRQKIERFVASDVVVS